MNAAQEQALVLGSLCLAAAVVLAVVLALSRASRFGVFLTINFLLAAALFWVQVVYGLSGRRSEVVVAAASELPVVLLVCWVCMAQVGALPSRLSSPPTGPVIQRPRLRRVLGLAPILLPAGWACGTLVGLVWPSPALQAYAPAPPHFLLFKWPISVSEGIWAGLAATVFALAAASPASATVLRLRNLTFAVSMLALALIAAESTAYAGVRLWVDGGRRREVLESFLAFEAVAAAVCFAALALGLALRYSPAVAAPLLGRLHTVWIPARERFESYRWRVMAGGGVRGAIRSSYRLEEAARLLRLSKSDTEKALSAIQLVAVMRDPSAETGRVAPAAARDLYDIQEEMSRDRLLWSRIGSAMRLRSETVAPGTTAPEPLQDALRAALDLMDPRAEAEEASRPLWFHLVAVAACDAGLVDKTAVQKQLDRQPAHEAASAAYRAAREALRSQTLRGW